MGISQHTTGTDNARCLIALCAITGNIGKPGAGLHPLRGQNNVQGASDMGLIPMFYPDYQKADDPGVKARFETAWGTADLDPSEGPDRHRDHRVRAQGRRARHVHARREPVPVRPEHQQGPQGAGQAGLPRRAGHLPDRDGRVRRRDPARLLLPGEGRHVHQHRPPRPARPQGARHPRPGAGGLGGRAGHRQQDRARVAIRVRAARSSRRWSRSSRATRTSATTTSG